MKSAVRWSLLVSLTVVLFFWKIVFTTQFSLLESSDIATQYTWIHHAAASLKEGTIPLWDPYAQSGRPFVGESPTGLFYPLKALFYLAPFTDRGVLSPELYNAYHVLAHILAAWFMLLLARELGLHWFAAYTSAISFALGGVVGKVCWPDYLDSAIWIPVLFLFLVRALRSAGRAQLREACLAGAALGLTLLAGRIHVAIMDALVVGSVGLYAALGVERPRRARATASRLRSAAMVVLVVVLIGAGIAAVQLLPSLEYSRSVVRYIRDGPIDALRKIPYSRMDPGLQPRALLEFVIGVPDWNRAEIGPYLGVLPFLLALIGAMRFWRRPWVRYLAVLAAAAAYCSLGVHSLLHGLLYSTIPFVWLVREPERFLYLAHFALAVLAGFGIEALVQDHAAEPFRRIVRVFGWFVLGFGATVAIAVVAGAPVINDWYYIAVLAAASSYGVFVWVARHGLTPAASFALAAVLVSDLHAFHWTIVDRSEAAKNRTDLVEQLFRSRPTAEFLRSQPGLFRVHFDAPETPNLGDLYRVQMTTGGLSATELKMHMRFRNESPRAGLALLNVRYLMRKEPLGSQDPVFADDSWKVYELAEYCPRAWLVHRATVETSLDRVIRRISERDFRPRDEALVAEPLDVALPPGGAESDEEVRVVRHEPHRIEVTARTRATSLLVLSEVFYPGWNATVNGAGARVHQVDGLLRGVVVPPGESRVVLVYAPRSVLAGAVVSCCAVLLVVLSWTLGGKPVRAPVETPVEVEHEVRVP